MRIRTKRRELRCRDCRVDVAAIDHWYMVHNAVWAAAGGSEGHGRDYLCLDCLEKRLGRPLLNGDFKPTDADNCEHWSGLDRMYPRSWWPLR